MLEIARGVVHWQTFSDRIGSRVSSYMLTAGGVVLDPRAPDEGFAGDGRRALEDFANA